MPNRAFTPEVWESLLKAYRTVPGNHSHAARAAGVAVTTARAAWYTGLQRYAWGKVPIQQVLADERLEARAGEQRARLTAADQAAAQRGELGALAHQHAVDTERKQLQAWDLTLQAILGDLAVSLSMLRPLKQVVDKWGERVLGGETVSTRDLAVVMRAKANSDAAMAEALHRLQDIQRRREDKPDMVVQVEPGPAALSMAEAQESFKQMQEVMRLASAAGIDLLQVPTTKQAALVVESTPAPIAPVPMPAPPAPVAVPTAGAP